MTAGATDPDRHEPRGDAHADRRPPGRVTPDRADPQHEAAGLAAAQAPLLRCERQSQPRPPRTDLLADRVDVVGRPSLGGVQLTAAPLTTTPGSA